MNLKQSLQSWFMNLGFGLTTIGLALFVLVLIAIVVVNYMTIKQQQVRQYDQSNTSPAAGPTKENATFSDSCDSIDKAGNPLVGDFMRYNNRAVGNLVGNIDKITFQNSTKSAAIIDMSSRDGYQHYSFSVNDQKGLVASDANKQQRAVKDLKFGDAIAVSFECDQKTNNKFLITQIEIVLERS